MTFPVDREGLRVLNPTLPCKWWWNVLGLGAAENNTIHISIGEENPLVGFAYLVSHQPGVHLYRSCTQSSKERETQWQLRGHKHSIGGLAAGVQNHTMSLWAPFRAAVSSRWGLDVLQHGWCLTERQVIWPKNKRVYFQACQRRPMSCQQKCLHQLPQPPPPCHRQSHVILKTGSKLQTTPIYLTMPNHLSTRIQLLSFPGLPSTPTPWQCLTWDSALTLKEPFFAWTPKKQIIGSGTKFLRRTQSWNESHW